MAISIKLQRTSNTATTNKFIVTAGSADTGKLQITYNGSDIYNNLSGSTADILNGASNTTIYIPLDTNNEIPKGAYYFNFVADSGTSDADTINFQISPIKPILSTFEDTYAPEIRVDDSTSYDVINGTVSSSTRSITLTYPEGSNQSNLTASSSTISSNLYITTGNVWTGSSQALLNYNVTWSIATSNGGGVTYSPFTYQEVGSGYENIFIDSENTLCDLYDNINALREQVTYAQSNGRANFQSLLENYQYVGALMSQLREAITCNKTAAINDIISQIKFIVGNGVTSTVSNPASRRIYGVSSQITMTISDASTEVQNVDSIVFSGATLTDDGDGQVTVTIASSPTLTVTDGTTTVNEVDNITVSGATVTDDGGGDITLTITGGSSITVANNTGLAIDESNVMSTIYNTTIGDAVESVAVGGADAAPASEWKTKTIVQALDTILFPTILASISTPKSVALTIDGTSGTLEIGSTVSRTLTATFNDGQIQNGDGTTGPDLVGAATLYTFTGTNISSTPQVGNTLAVSNTIVSGSNNWAVTVNHNAGSGAYYDNKGNAGTNLDASRVSGTTSDSTSSPTVTGVYPVFWYKSASPITASSMASAIQAGSTTKVVTSSTGTITIDFDAAGEYLAVAYPATSTTKTKWYVNALDNGTIPGGVFGSATTQSVTSPDAYWSSISYKIHVSPGLITQSEPIELRNS